MYKTEPTTNCTRTNQTSNKSMVKGLHMELTPITAQAGLLSSAAFFGARSCSEFHGSGRSFLVQFRALLIGASPITLFHMRRVRTLSNQR